MKSLRRWLTFMAIAISLASVDAYPVLANDDGIPLPSAVEYVLTQTPAPANPSPAPAKLDGRVMRIFATEYRFIPNVVKIRRSEKATLELKNEGKDVHNLTFPTLSLKTPDIPPGGTALLPLPANLSPGRYPFVCTVPGHQQRGMRGVLVVT
ncbi:MAG: hypothetical protein A2201_08620 [Alicyclobacillus sp. RIFOXYA1_FULL_53_8]|nr:MAG: hypothetical protein A2201_08620 [Alicyclobacillus sp. RIFOXYA1_FULL_53_8]